LREFRETPLGVMEVTTFDGGHALARIAPHPDKRMAVLRIVIEYSVASMWLIVIDDQYRLENVELKRAADGSLASTAECAAFVQTALPCVLRTLEEVPVAVEQARREHDTIVGRGADHRGDSTRVMRAPRGARRNNVKK